MSHTCHAEGCNKRVPPAMFACRAHWFALPKKPRDAIWRQYVPGQEDRKDPSPMYMAVQRYAVAWLARRDGLPFDQIVWSAVMWETKCRELKLGEPLAGLDRFWEES